MEVILIERAGRVATLLVPVPAQPNASGRMFGQNLLGITYIARALGDPMSEEELKGWGSDLAALDPDNGRALITVTGGRRVYELRGISCLPLGR